MKVTFVDFTEESTSKSVESTFETLIIEIDVRLYQYSCVDSSKWQEMAKNYWHKHENYHSDQLKVQMKCFFLFPNLKEQQKSGRSPFTVS